MDNTSPSLHSLLWINDKDWKKEWTGCRSGTRKGFCGCCFYFWCLFCSSQFSGFHVGAKVRETLMRSRTDSFQGAPSPGIWEDVQCMFLLFVALGIFQVSIAVEHLMYIMCYFHPASVHKHKSKADQCWIMHIRAQNINITLKVEPACDAFWMLPLHHAWVRWFASALPAQVMQYNLIPWEHLCRAGAGGWSHHIVVSIIKQTEKAGIWTEWCISWWGRQGQL